MDSIGARFSWNQFTARGYVNGAGPLRTLDDHEVNELRLSIDREFNFRPTENFFANMIDHLTHANPWHPVLEYLDSLEWDNTTRIGGPNTASWLTTYGGAEDTEYTRAVGRLILVAAVRRVRQPGCKFDEMLVLVNPEQGTDKSSALQVLARNPDWFTDNMPLRVRDPKVIMELLAGKWIVENAELDGIPPLGRGGN